GFDVVAIDGNDGHGGLVLDGTLNSTFAIAAELRDLNSDGSLDLILVNGNADQISVLLGSAGGFGTPSTYPAGITPVALAIADLNRDGVLDVVTVDVDVNSLS